MYALREEDDILENQTGRWPRYFYPRPPRGGRQHRLRHVFRAVKFLSTPSVRRATGMLCGHVMAMRISIHALREEGDALPARRRWSGSYFYPRPPRGGRRFTGKAALEWKLFLSTPSARRTTKRLEGLTPIQKFLSTPSAGRATAAERPPLLDIIFLSTPSAGRATSCPCTRSRHPDYFYPRPPRGGRPVRNSPQLPSAHISIHALREEGDEAAASIQKDGVLFLSTPSARRATDLMKSLCLRLIYFYPRPP